MKKELPARKNIRLQGYDYSRAGCYFVTLCVKDGHEMLGKIVTPVGAISNRPNTLVELTKHGYTVEKAIREIPICYQGVTVDNYVIMPNHMHMIITLRNGYDSGGRLIIAPTKVSAIVQQYKRSVTKQIGFSMWQKSYHDHIIRDEDEYRRIWQYIDENPAKWTEDKYYG